MLPPPPPPMILMSCTSTYRTLQSSENLSLEKLEWHNRLRIFADMSAWGNETKRLQVL